MLKGIFDPIANLLGDWSYESNIWGYVLKIGLAIVLSAIIGYERSNKRHAAGLRTFIMITLASTIAMIIDLFLIEEIGVFMPLLSAATIIAVAIISANTILFSSKSQIKGLTTCAGLWANAILGLLIGTGCYTLVLICTVAYICVLSLFPRLEIYFKNRSNHFEVHLELKNISYLKDFVKVVRELGLRVDDIESNTAYLNSGLSVYSVSLSIVKEELKKFKTHEEIILSLGTLEYINHIEEM